MAKVACLQSIVWMMGLLLGCSTNEGTGAFGSSSGASTSGGSSGASLGQGGGATLGVSGATSTGGSAGASGTMVSCTEGEDCECSTISVAVLGKPGIYGGGDTTAFMTWLTSSSSGTDRVDSYPERESLTADFLAPYDVLVLLGLGEDSDIGPFWTFEASEVTAVQSWVEAGGGIISLNGAATSGDEINPPNQLFAFAGISYNADGLTPDCTLLDTNNAPVCWCGGSAAPVIDFNTDDPVVAELATGITRVGIHNGRGINAPEDAHVAATIVNGSSQYNVLVGKLAGAGRVLAFSDEWITYTSQWSATTDNASCTDYMPQTVYQTAQFWYNMIKWVQPAATCFKIVDSEQEVVLW